MSDSALVILHLCVHKSVSCFPLSSFPVSLGVIHIQGVLPRELRGPDNAGIKSRAKDTGMNFIPVVSLWFLVCVIAHLCLSFLVCNMGVIASTL